jgi:hypothetical protein
MVRETICGKGVKNQFGIMKHYLAMILIAISFTVHAIGTPALDEDLQTAARKAFSRAFSDREVQDALTKGLWTPDRRAVAVAVCGVDQAELFVFLRVKSGLYVSVNVSPLERTNLGRLGTLKREDYQRVVTTPVEWIPRTDKMLEIQMRTQVWRLGKRKTTSGSVVIEPGGTCIWQ